MSLYPGAILKLIPRHDTLMTRHRGICNHVAVSEQLSLWGYFSNPDTTVCSHFYVRKSGVVEQYVDTKFRAPANYQGNPSLISIETQGGVYNTNTEPWTAEQRVALAKLWAWANQVYGIPLVQMPDSRTESGGICYHRQGIDPWRVEGGEYWSQSYGKICPGQGKINQIPGILVLARSGDFNMDLTQANLDDIAKAVIYGLMSNGQTLNNVIITGMGRTTSVYEEFLETGEADNQLDQIVTTLGSGGEINTQLDRIEAKEVVINYQELAIRIAEQLGPLLPGLSQDMVEAALSIALNKVQYVIINPTS